MSERKMKREKMLKRRQTLKRVIVNIFTGVILCAVGTFFYCLMFGVFREGGIIL